MTVSSRFAVASHVLALLSTPGGSAMSSEQLALSVGVNPVIVRGVSSMLRRAGLVRSRRGVAGLGLSKSAEHITLLEVYYAVQPPERLIALHQHPNPACAVGQHIHAVLGEVCAQAQAAFESQLAQTTLADVQRQLQTAQKGRVLLPTPPLATD